MLNLLETYTVILIDQDGKEIYVTSEPDFEGLDGYIYIPREKYRASKNTYDHNLFFRCLEEKVPDLLLNMIDKEKANAGFPFAESISANNRVIIWPTNLGNPSIVWVTMPKVPTRAQQDSIKELLPGFTSAEYMLASTAYYVSEDSFEIGDYSLASMGSHEAVCKTILDFFDSLETDYTLK